MKKRKINVLVISLLLTLIPLMFVIVTVRERQSPPEESPLEPAIAVGLPVDNLASQQTLADYFYSSGLPAEMAAYLAYRSLDNDYERAELPEQLSANQLLAAIDEGVAVELGAYALTGDLAHGLLLSSQDSGHSWTWPPLQLSMVKTHLLGNLWQNDWDLESSRVYVDELLGWDWLDVDLETVLTPLMANLQAYPTSRLQIVGNQLQLSPVAVVDDLVHLFDEPYGSIQEYGETHWSANNPDMYAPKGYHDGIDLVPLSTKYTHDFEERDIPIYSLTDGRVLYQADYGQMGGYALVIETRDGDYLYYGHLKYLPHWEEGAPIRKGQVIATLGASGVGNCPQPCPHVHLAYYRTLQELKTLEHLWELPLKAKDRNPSSLFLESHNFTHEFEINPEN